MPIPALAKQARLTTSFVDLIAEYRIDHKDLNATKDIQR
jgi:hypothetical protein